MDQVDSLNEMALQNAVPITDVGVSGGNVANASQVIAVAADLPSFQYFISEQAKSILALQELQNEVGALLEFRDLVMEAFPQLGQKVQNMQSQNAMLAISQSKWEPGIRVKRKLGQHLRDPDMLVPSLLPRYRSNSQGKASRSGEISSSATSSSAIQDSGFCTESSKDHLSALSSRSKSRDSSDELFSLLDHIHSKGTRLKLEVEYLWSRLHRKEDAGGVVGGTSSLAGPAKRRCKSLDDLMFASNAQSFTFDYALKTAFLETELAELKGERDSLLKKLHEIESEHLANVAQTNRLLTELETMSSEKRELEERLQLAIHAEHNVNDRINDLHANFLTRNKWRNAQTPFAKCQLLKLEQVFKGMNSGVDGSGAVASSGATVETATITSAAAAAVTHAMPTPRPSAAYEDAYFKLSDEQSSPPLPLPPPPPSLPDVDATKVERPGNPVTKELNYDDAAAAAAGSYCEAENGDVPRVKLKTSSPLLPDAVSSASNAASVLTLASTKDFNDTIDHKLNDSRGGIGASVGKPDVLIGFVSGHHPLSFDSAVTFKQDGGAGGGVTLSKEKVLSILTECDPKTLRCFLLTLSYQVEALNVHVQRVSKSRMNIFKQLSRYKFENEDLRLELKKKEIELEGTKAQKRVLEQKRDIKLSYSTSDLMTTSMMATKSCGAATPDLRTDTPYACSVSDSALMTSRQRATVSTLCGRGSGRVESAGGSGGCAKRVNLRDSFVVDQTTPKSGTACRRSFSKIPLKTYSSKLPTAKLGNPCSGKKTLTSFKEYSAPGPPHSSCISSTSSSLNHK